MKRQALLWLAIVLASLFVSVARAGEAVPLAEDEAVERRLVAISGEMRCMVCQNESLAASNAPLAVNLRREIRKMIKEDKTDEEITGFLVARYGDFVRYRPPLRTSTVALWFGPPIFLVVGLVLLVTYLRRRDAKIGKNELSAEDRARAEAILQGKEPR